MKTCNKCHSVKKLSEFYKSRAKCKDCILDEQALHRSHPEVREYYRVYSGRWRKNNAERSAEYERGRSIKRAKKFNDEISKYFVERKCRVCGYEKCFAAIDYHHIDPKEKKFLPKLFIRQRATLSGIPNKALKEFHSELKKCIPLCSNCHREYHFGMLVLDNYVS